jgi:NNP family nitrate/nitrite transporter-like MFS transporter
LHNQYQLNAIEAGNLAATAAFMGSTLRPLGGYLADKLGGVRTLTVVFAIVFAFYALASLLLPIGIATALIIIGVAFLGIGNGAVFQLVPQCFRAEIGVATGLVGAFGGIGGFLLPILMGNVKQGLHSYAPGWVVLAGFTLIAIVALRILVALHSDWRSSWAVMKETDPATAIVGSPQLTSPA